MGDGMTRGSGAVAIALMGCVAGCLASGTAGADVASAAPAAAIRAAGTATATCAPHLDTYSRTRLCWRVGATVAVVRGATRVGIVTFALTHDIQLDPRGRNWAERITISTDAGGYWWDVAVPEVSVRSEVRAAREKYEAAIEHQFIGN